MGNIYLGEKELTQVQNINILSGDVETLSGDVGTVSGNVKNHVEDETIHVTSTEKSNWNNKVDENDITNFFDGAKYEDSGTTKVINFYHGDTIKATINATDFIKDGMVSNVEVKEVAGSGTCLVITFNEDSGTGSTKHEDINIPLTDIFDPSNYYTTGQTSGATELTTAFAAKQDVLTEGRAIDITSNVISLDLPISAGTGTNSIIEGDGTTASGTESHAEGYSTTANGACSHAEGSVTKASGNNSHAEGYETSASSIASHAEGRGTQANGTHSHAEGSYTVANNKSEHASGQFNVSSKASTTFGNSGNTLFSVGNGTSTSARHNAFEVRQNGDIYITSGSSDIRLQDCLNDTTYSAGTAAQLSAGTNTYNGIWSAKNIKDGIDKLYACKKELTNEDLNDVLEPGFYNAGGSNTCTNKPTGFTTAFGLQVIHTAAGEYYEQIIYENASNNSYRRACSNGTWGNWVKDEHVNQNAFSNVKVGSITIAADTTTDTIEMSAGSFVSLTGDATNDKLTIGVSTGTTSSTLARGDHSHSNYVPTGRTITAASGLTGGGKLSGDVTIGLATTGTAGTYGPTANVTGTEGTTIKIPQITTDAYGRVTSVTERTLTNKNSTYTVNNGTFTISGNGTSVASTSANASANSGLNIKSGSNVTITTGTNEITIAAIDTNTKVTSVGNHYTPASSTTKSASASGGGTLAFGGSVISGVTLNVDAAGHVTNVSVSSAKLPSNPNTWRSIKVNGTNFLTDTTTALNLSAGTNVTLTTGSTGLITIKATDTKYTAATAAPGKVASASASGTSTNYARQDHTHGIDLATGDSNGQVKIAGTNVSVKGLGTAAYQASGYFAGSGHTHSAYVPTGRTITAASGLTGGGNLSANRTIGLATTGTAGTYYRVVTDAYGRVISGNTTDANTDTKVVQSSSTTSSYRGILMGENTNANPNSGINSSVTSQTYVTNNLTVQPSTGNIVSKGSLKGTQLISSVATGTAPLSVASTTKVTNLNADYLDGNDVAWFMKRGVAYTASKSGTFYQKVATTTITTAGTHDASITLLVSSQYTNDSGNGILNVVCRKGSGVVTADTSGTYAKWVSNDRKIDNKRFILTFKCTNSSASTWNLYCKQTGTWMASRFTMLDEGSWYGKSNTWTLLTASGGTPNGYTAIPSDETQFVSSYNYMEANYYVSDATGTAGTSTNRTIWNGKILDVKSLYTGLRVDYKLPVSGASAGCTLNINSLGEHPVVINSASLVTTHYPVGTILPLIYDADASATITANSTSSSITGTWKVAEYGTSYSTGTAALLTAGTNTTNRVWSAKVLRDGLDSLYKVSAGRAINVTNKVISLNLPISAGTGTNSIIEGNSTTASGNVSHAEGQGTIASGSYSHAEGYETKASGSQSHAEGSSTKASGTCAHAEGAGTQAIGFYSHAEGFNTKASGQYSHAEGQNTTASSGSSHAEGFGTTASGDSSHAEGNHTRAIGPLGSHAEGDSTTASGETSHAEGYNTIAHGICAHAEGDGTKAIGDDSHAEGDGTEAIGDDSHAEGRGTTASGDSSHAEGRGTKASGNHSHAEGYNTTASNTSSHAEGYNTKANANQAHSEGSNTEALGSRSHAEGYYTVANSSYSHAEGYYTVTKNQSEHASGQYNVSSSASTTFGVSGNTLFSVGNGTSDSARHNAFEIRQNGLSYMNGNVQVSGTVSQVSDERLKNIIEDKELLLEEIVNAPLVSYTFKGVENDSPHIGTIAQYWLDILPEVVCEYDSEENNLSLDYSSLNVAIGISLAKIIKKQSIEIDSLKEEITLLKQNIGKIE